MTPLFEITFWSGRQVRLRAFDVVGARVLAAEECDKPIRKVEVV